MEKLESHEAYDRLERLRNEMEASLNQIKDVLLHLASDPERSIYERARVYWLAHIEGALRGDSEWLGGSFINMDNTLKEVEEAG